MQIPENKGKKWNIDDQQRQLTARWVTHKPESPGSIEAEPEDGGGATQGQHRTSGLCDLSIWRVITR